MTLSVLTKFDRKGVNKPEPVSVPDRETPGLTRNVKITKLSVKLGPMQRRGKVKILHCLPANLL